MLQTPDNYEPGFCDYNVRLFDREKHMNSLFAQAEFRNTDKQLTNRIEEIKHENSEILDSELRKHGYTFNQADKNSGYRTALGNAMITTLQFQYRHDVELTKIINTRLRLAQILGIEPPKDLEWLDYQPVSIKPLSKPEIKPETKPEPDVKKSKFFENDRNRLALQMIKSGEVKSYNRVIDILPPKYDLIESVG